MGIFLRTYILRYFHFCSSLPQAVSYPSWSRATRWAHPTQLFATQNSSVSNTTELSPLIPLTKITYASVTSTRTAVRVLLWGTLSMLSLQLSTPNPITTHHPPLSPQTPQHCPSEYSPPPTQFPSSHPPSSPIPNSSTSTQAIASP